MSRRLAIDIGNTRLKIGIFSGNDLVMIDSREVNEWDQSYINGWYENFVPQYVIVSSTIELSAEAVKWMKKVRAFVVHPFLRYPFKISYKTSGTLGQDRLAAFSAVFSLYKKQNVLVLDAGTCITYDFLSSSGEYVGGNISPGIQMRLAAMHYYTEKLPRVFMTGEIKWRGQSTEEAIRAGGGAMAVMEYQGLVTYVAEQDVEVARVHAGGRYCRLVTYVGGEKFVEPNLVLLGLNEIMKNNEI